MIDQPAGRRIDGELQPGIVERLLDVGFGRVHREANTSARWSVRMGSPARSMTPWSCIRQLESMETMVDAPVFWMESILVRAMAPETSGNLTENVPPKPQHSSATSISASVR